MQRPGPKIPPNLQLRIRGAVLGAVLGDAFGAPFAGASPGPELTRDVHERDGAVRPWSYAEGGAMAIALAESLTERRGFEPAHVASQSGSAENAAVRVSPLAALLHADAATLSASAATSARLIHASPEATAATVIHAVAVGALVRGTPPAALLGEMRAASDPALDAVASLLASGVSVADAAKKLGTRPLARESVPFALFCFLRDPTRHEALMDAVAAGGATDSIGSLVGALLGAANGAGIFPRQWVHNLENGPRGRDTIVDLADAILEIASSG